MLQGFAGIGSAFVRRGAASALCALVVGILLSSSARAADDGLASIPFWRTSAGWWRSENTYFSPTLDYNIRSYNSLVHIEVEGRRVVETEYKFYSPSKLAFQHGAGKAREDEGVEQVTVTTYERVDRTGTVRLVTVEPRDEPAPATTTIQVLNADTAQRVVRDPGAPADLYRALISMPTHDKRYIANYGLVASPAGGGVLGGLRGFSTFHGTRVRGEDFAAVRAELRERNKVHVVVTAGPDGSPVARRLD